MLSSFRDHFDLHQRENGKVTMNVEVPKCIFQGIINAMAWSNMFYSERDKRGDMVT